MGHLKHFTPPANSGWAKRKPRPVLAGVKVGVRFSEGCKKMKTTGQVVDKAFALAV